jgi:hypothetical protein
MRSTAFIVCITLFSAAAYAQNGTLAGTVSAPGGEPAASASVQAKNAQSGATFKATTAKDGRYSIAALPPGAYDVSVTLPAVNPFNQKGVAVAAAKTTTLDARLTETTQLSTLGEDTQHALEDLPASGGRP